MKHRKKSYGVFKIWTREPNSKDESCREWMVARCWYYGNDKEEERQLARARGEFTKVFEPLDPQYDAKLVREVHTDIWEDYVLATKDTAKSMK